MTLCQTCAYADVHGWWGPANRGGTHCRGCHRSWTSGREAHCTLCHRHFGGNDGFERHLESAPDFETAAPADALTCRDPAQMTKKDGSPVLVADDDGIWRKPFNAPGLRGNL